MYGQDCLAIINCGKTKRDEPCQASEMYLGTLFTVSRNYVQQHFENWIIISAKYGMLLPTDVIVPYDVCIDDLTTSEKVSLLQKTASQVREKFPDVSHYYFYTLTSYSEVSKYLDGECLFPLKGLVGRQKLHFLKTGQISTVDVDTVLEELVQELHKGVGYRKKVIVELLSNKLPAYSLAFINRIIDCSTINCHVELSYSIKRRNIFEKIDGKYYLVGDYNKKRLF